MSEDRERALTESHKLLRHYSKLLNMHDGGERVIPEDLDEWVERVNQSNVKVVEVSDLEVDT